MVPIPLGPLAQFADSDTQPRTSCRSAPGRLPQPRCTWGRHFLFLNSGILREEVRRGPAEARLTGRPEALVFLGAGYRGLGWESWRLSRYLGKKEVWGDQA